MFTHDDVDNDGHGTTRPTKARPIKESNIHNIPRCIGMPMYAQSLQGCKAIGQLSSTQWTLCMNV